MGSHDHDPDMSLALRDAAAADRSALNDVFKRASLSNEGDRELLLAHPEVLELTAADLATGRTRVALEGERIVGFATLVPGDGALELDALFVDPDRMRQGIATALIADAAAIARVQGIDAIEVTGNDHAMAFYEATGFMVIGEADTPLGVRAARLRRPV
jgi:GNAT superfamily N-acetyltransferase